METAERLYCWKDIMQYCVAFRNAVISEQSGTGNWFKAVVDEIWCSRKQDICSYVEKYSNQSPRRVRDAVVIIFHFFHSITSKVPE